MKKYLWDIANAFVMLALVILGPALIVKAWMYILGL